MNTMNAATQQTASTIAAPPQPTSTSWSTLSDSQKIAAIHSAPTAGSRILRFVITFVVIVAIKVFLLVLINH